MANLHQLLKAMVDQGASDLHITTGSPPQLRIDGELVPLQAPQPADAGRDQAAVLLDSHRRPEAQVRGGERARPVVRREGALAVPAQHLHAARRGGGRVPHHSVQDPHVPGAGPAADRARSSSKRPRGLILVTGPTGSGKSTTLASIIDKINTDRHEHIMTIEDPIEYLHPHKNCLVNQREVGADTQSFKTALKYILRQDPDVVLVGEMRDLETIEAALVIAETGHIAFATLHTNSAVQTINRILDVFPPYQQPQVRAQLSFVLEGIMSQALLGQGHGRRPGAGARGDGSQPRHPQPHPRRQGAPDLLVRCRSARRSSACRPSTSRWRRCLARKLIRMEEAFGRTSDPDELKNIIASGGGAWRCPGHQVPTGRWPSAEQGRRQIGDAEPGGEVERFGPVGASMLRTRRSTKLGEESHGSGLASPKTQPVPPREQGAGLSLGGEDPRGRGEEGRDGGERRRRRSRPASCRWACRPPRSEEEPPRRQHQPRRGASPARTS